MKETAEEYAPGDVLIGRLGAETCSLYLPRQGRVLLVPAAVVAALLKSHRFDTLEGHARRLAEQFQMAANSVPALTEELGELVQRGALVSKAQLLGRPRSRPPGGDIPLNTLAIPTRERPLAVERCLSSFSRVAEMEGRALRAVVVDSTPDPSRAEQTRQALRGVQRTRGTSVLFASSQEVARFAVTLARTAAVPDEVARFALSDLHEVGGCDTGANRNALLLGLAGSVFLMTDDDTLADVRGALPAAADLVISGSADPSRMWIYRDEGEAERAPTHPEVSLFQRCQRLLGRSVTDIAGDLSLEAVRFEEVRPDLLGRLLSGAASVGVVATGIWGDSGARFPCFYLWNRPELVEPLTRDDSTYAVLSRSRQMIRQVATPTVTGGGFLMSTCLGLDNRGLLPPFLPVGRGQDLSFGTMLQKVSDRVLVGHLPEAVTHRPTDGRGQQAQDLWDPANHLDLSAVVDALLALVSQGLETAPSAESRLRRMGANLQELAAQPWPEIDRLLQRELWQRLVRRVTGWESSVRSRATDGPWLRDLERFQDHLFERVVRGDPALPDLLLVGRDPEQAAATLRAFLADLGRLLGCWPALMAAARQLRQEGRGLFGPDTGS